MQLKRILRAGAAALLASGALATAASAHTTVSATSPGAGKTAKTSIRSVSVTFTGKIVGGTLRVVGPGGRVASSGSGGRDPRKVTRLAVPLKRGLAAGWYTASWAITAADGHGQRGSFRFRLRR